MTEGPETTRRTDTPDRAPQRAPRRLSRVTMDTRPFGYPQFRRLFAGNVLTQVGAQMTLVAVGVQVYRMTGSSAMVGYTSLWALIPLIVFGLIGGALADTIDRRTLVIWSTLLTALTSLMLYLQAAAGLDNVWIVWALVALQSAAAAAYRPARSAMLPKLIPESLIPAANTISSSTMSGSMIVGPLVAGVIVAHAGVTWAYLAEAVLLVLAILTLFGLPVMAAAHDTGGRSPFRTALSDTAAGFRYLRTQPLLSMQYVVDLIAMIFGWPLAVFPALADQRFGEGSIGWLYAGASIGAVAAGLFSGWISHIVRHGATIIASVAVWGGAIIAFAFTDSLLLGLFFLAVAGAADLVSASLRMTMLQVLTPDAMRGRMQGVFMVVVAGGPRLGDVRLGQMATLLTPTVALWSGGLTIVVLMLVIALTFRLLWRYRPADSSAA
ncbi:MFS transporter [Cumulibacter manganitolerans]|uniref:MFS transporter n=1 Tax=Cumulibacter manganitolerans TaxID=1884992 RepID=UPI00129550D7|nr:MFS transporter [Cumulibacter manganitolerans]